MHAPPADGNGGLGRVEAFILKLAQNAAVHGIRVVRAKCIQIDVVHPCPDFLIGCKCNGNGTVGNLRVRQKMRRHGHNLRHTGLIVRPEERGSVGDYQALPCVGCHLREVGKPQDNRTVLI